MALPKLPCEYPSIEKGRFNNLFGNLNKEEQIEMRKKLNSIMELCQLKTGKGI